MLRKSKVLLTLVLALLLCVTSVSTAFATNLNDDDALIGTEDNPVQAAITKNLRLPEATTIPNVNFNFIVTPVEVDGTPFNPDAHNMPTLGAATTPPTGVGTFTLSFSDADADQREQVTNLVNTMSVQKETPNIFAGATFPHAGIYEYTVTEQPNTNSAIDADTNVNEWLSYSPAEYTLTVYVANTENEDNADTFVYALGTLVSTPNPGQPSGIKVDPTPGGYEGAYRFSQMVFINDYVRNNGPVEPEKASTLAVSKTVTGDFASKDQPFNFSIELTIPSIVPNIPAFYRAYIVDVDDSVSSTSIQVSTSVPTPFSLKHGQRLVFVDTPVGTSYEVTEMGAANYFPRLSVTTNGSTSDYPELDRGEDYLSGRQLVGEAENSADFTNRRDTVTPTGLNLNDLPFILLIVLGLGGLATFIVVKVRKRTRYS